MPESPTDGTRETSRSKMPPHEIANKDDDSQPAASVSPEDVPADEDIGGGTRKDGGLPEENDDNADQRSDDALPEDEEEQAIRRNMSGGGIRYEPQ